MIVDAHQHFWNLDRISYSWLTPEFDSIYRTIEPPELKPFLERTGIEKTILIQAMDSDEETEYMLEKAAFYPWIAGVVGWVPLDEPNEAANKLHRYIQHPNFKGIRHLIHEEKDPDWIVKDEVVEGLKILASYGLPFDVVAEFPNHLKHVPYLAEKVPDLKIVIDHLAKPPLEKHAIEQWSKDLKRASKYQQVHAKISGLNTVIGGNWTAEDLQPYIDFAKKSFGADRLMFGSDWPIANLAGDYMKVWQETNNVLRNYTSKEVDAILGGTAINFYGLKEG